MAVAVFQIRRGPRTPGPGFRGRRPRRGGRPDRRRSRAASPRHRPTGRRRLRDAAHPLLPFGERARHRFERALSRASAPSRGCRRAPRTARDCPRSRSRSRGGTACRRRRRSSRACRDTEKVTPVSVPDFMACFVSSRTWSPSSAAGPFAIASGSPPDGCRSTRIRRRSPFGTFNSNVRSWSPGAVTLNPAGGREGGMLILGARLSGTPDEERGCEPSVLRVTSVFLRASPARARSATGESFISTKASASNRTWTRYWQADKPTSLRRRAGPSAEARKP